MLCLSLKLIDVIDFGRGNTCVIVVNCLLNVFCMVMGLEAPDYALVHRLDMGCEVWFKIHNMDVLKTVWNDMAQEIIL